MYWVLANERSDEYEFSLDSVPPLIESNDLDFGEGVVQAVGVPEIDIPYNIHRDEWLTDNIVVPPVLGFLINKKVRSVFDSLDIDNIQYIPVRLIEENTNDVRNDYCIANIIGKYSCVDFEASELEFFEDGEIEFIDKLALSVGDNDEPGHIFRLGEFPPLTIISNQLKESIEESGITGFKIYRPQDFSL